MTGSDSEERRVVLWELRLGTALPLPPFATGALVAGLLIAGGFAYQALIGAPIRVHGELLGLFDVVRNTIINSVFCGYVIAASSYGALGVSRDLRELGVDAGDGLAIPVSRAARYRRAGVLGVVLGIAILVAAQLSLGFPVSNLWQPELAWFVGVTLLLSFGATRAAYATLQRSPQLRDLRDAPVDLLDLRGFQALGRIALRNALLFIIGISLLVPFALVPGYAPTFAVIMTAALVVPTLALLLPVRGVRRRIRAARRAELERIDAELRQLRDAGEDAPPGRQADLYARRAYVESVREWPYDTSSLARFGLYLLIPLASWIGSALVERLVDTVVD